MASKYNIASKSFSVFAHLIIFPNLLENQSISSFRSLILSQFPRIEIYIINIKNVYITILLKKTQLLHFWSFCRESANTTEISLQHWKGTLPDSRRHRLAITQYGDIWFLFRGLQLARNRRVRACNFSLGVLRREARSCHIATARHSTGRDSRFEGVTGVELEDSQLQIVDHRRRPLISH